jgi:hypothetical protein
MDKPANPPLPDGSEPMQKVRPSYRVLLMLLAVAEFGAAVSMGLRHGLWPLLEGLLPTACLAFFGFACAVAAVTGYPPFRHNRWMFRPPKS